MNVDATLYQVLRGGAGSKQHGTYLPDHKKCNNFMDFLFFAIVG
jgi:hypothetical protein